MIVKEYLALFETAKVVCATVPEQAELIKRKLALAIRQKIMAIKNIISWLIHAIRCNYQEQGLDELVCNSTTKEALPYYKSMPNDLFRF